jgi:glyoxylase-like metal-dependent hydrolase (beta-lactamase superfamily II)
MKPGNHSCTGSAVVEVLIVGYCYALEDEPSAERACSTVTLVEDGDVRVVCDPGSTSDPVVLTAALADRGLTVDDITWIFLSHYHPDHCKYAGLFPEAGVLDYWGEAHGDVYRAGIRDINGNIRAIETPGHSRDSMTLLVDTARGRVAVCGDVFWDHRRDFEDPYADDPAALMWSRERLLETVDFIVPGHGDIFKTD